MKPIKPLIWLASHWQALATLLAALVIAGWLYHLKHQEPANPVGQALPAVKSWPVSHLTTEGFELKKPLRVYPKKIEKKLHLPDEVTQNPQKRVADAVDVPNDGHAHRVVPVADGATGEIKTYVEVLPKCWLCFTSRGDIGAYAGLDTNGDQRGMVQLRQGVINVRDITLGVMLTGTQTFGGHAPVNNDASAMVGAWYGWGK